MEYLPDGTCGISSGSSAHGVFVNWQKPGPCISNFHLFRLLPIEMRRKIWKCALPPSRTLRLDTFYFGSSTHDLKLKYENTDNKGSSEFKKQCVSLTKTCREAHTVFHENYHLVELNGCSTASLWGEDSFELPDLGDTTQVRLERMMVDGKQDHLILRHENIVSLDKANACLDLSRIENVALQFYHSVDTKVRAKVAADFTRTHPNLKSLNILLGDENVDVYPWTRGEYHLLEVGNKFDSFYMSPQADPYGLPGYMPTSAQVKSRIEETKRSANDLFREFETLMTKYTGRKKRIELKASLWTIVARGRGPTTQCLYLVPTKPQYHGVSFYTDRPIPRKKLEYRLEIPELECSAPCRYNGSEIISVDYVEFIRFLFGELDLD